MHIPESSEPMDDAACKKSYEMAYAFFEKHRDFLGANSSIVRFMDEFDMIKTYEYDNFTAPWWIFGCGLKEDITQYPQNTRLQRAYVNWLLEGKNVGSALGVRLQGNLC